MIVTKEGNTCTKFLVSVNMAKYSIKIIYRKSQTQIQVNGSEKDIVNNNAKAMGDYY